MDGEMTEPAGFKTTHTVRIWEENRLACVGPIEMLRIGVLAAVKALPAMASGEVTFG